MRHEHCICNQAPTIESPVDILVIRHWKERNKPSNTARLAGIAIPNLRIVDYGAPGTQWDPKTLDIPKPALLFPDPDAPELPYEPQTVVVVDGSWPQARKLVNKLHGLNQMPRIHVPPPTHAPIRLRQPPIPGGMSTIEAIARLMDMMMGKGSGSPLDDLYKRVVEATIEARGRPLR